MSLSGAQVTRLWPYGGSGHQYGDFSVKEQAGLDGTGIFLVYHWIWETWK